MSLQNVQAERKCVTSQYINTLNNNNIYILIIKIFIFFKKFSEVMQQNDSTRYLCYCKPVYIRELFDIKI